jgi:segregation and condensation protein B
MDRAAAAQATLSLNETEAVLEAAAEADPSLGPEFEPMGVAGEATVEVAGGAPEVDAARAEKARAARLRGHFCGVLDGLIAEYASGDRGLEIREVAGGFRFATKPEYHDAVRGFVKSLKPPLKLTLQALETLAVVAYKQPVTSPEISEIRGVDSAGVLGSLIARKLITTAGRKHVIGRPILYKTTREFLLRFGLKEIAELPSIEEFEKMAGQMADQEEIPMENESRQMGESEEERLESDGEAQPPEPVADEVIVDGRLSGLPPRYDDEADDPSAQEAEIQEAGIQESGRS